MQWMDMSVVSAKNMSEGYGFRGGNEAGEIILDIIL